MVSPIEGLQMSKAHTAVINQILRQAHGLHPEMDEAEFFEFFSAKQVLRDFLVDNDDIQSGLVGQSSTVSQAKTTGSLSSQPGTDGGIDGIYLFVNGDLIRDPDQAESTKALKRNIHIDVVIIQASGESGFGLNRLIRLKDTSENIFNIERLPVDFTEQYNEPLLDAIQRFRVVHRLVSNKFPAIHISYFYVTKGDRDDVFAPDFKKQSDVSKKSEALKSSVQEILPTINKCSFTFVGARDLCELATKPPKFNFLLRCVDTFSDRGAYVALVPLTEYNRFITDDNGDKREHLFDSNVRGYQGPVDVNEAISKTLRAPVSLGEDFWWLNNGITIICAKVGGDHRNLDIEDPQVVNGHQTSQEIYEYFRSVSSAVQTETRSLVVRIIKATEIETQDRIIRATNSQTSIPPAYLWATDPIHRDIEKLFAGNGLYYDRRKNSWRSSTIPAAKVVGITELAQSVASIHLQEPDHSRARPARYFKDKEYKRVFSEDLLDIYPICAQLRKRVESFLRKEVPDKRHRNNLIFYVLMAVTCVRLHTPKAQVGRIKSLSVDSVTDAQLQTALNATWIIYERLGASDKAAKGPDMVAALKVDMRKKFGRKKD